VKTSVIKKAKSSNPVRLGCFYGIGVGPGDPELLTLKAQRALESVDVIFHAAGARSTKSVSGDILRKALKKNTRLTPMGFSMSRSAAVRAKAWRAHARRVADVLKRGRNCAFVTIGDPLLYGTYIYLMREVKRLIPDLKIQTVPGITSFQAAAALANMPLVEDREVLVIAPAWTPKTVKHPALEHADTLVLLKTYRHRRSLAKAIKRLKCREGIYAAKIGFNGQILERDLSRLHELPREYLSLVIAKKKKHEH